MEKKSSSFDLEHLSKDLEKLSQEAESGSFEASRRLEAIRKLANPIFDFSASDYRRILDKKLPLPVKKGIKLYKMMSQLTYLVQPVGNKKGLACSVRRVDYENLTWEELLEMRGNFNMRFINEAIKQRAAPCFEGLDLLDDRQRELYQRIQVYFGHRKGPTLQSLAMNLLSEETDGKDFSERSLYIYLEAITKYRQKRKKAAGFDAFQFTFHPVTSFGSGKTVGQSLEDWDQSLKQSMVSVGPTFAEMSSNILNRMMPKFKDLISNIPVESEKDTPSK